MASFVPRSEAEAQLSYDHACALHERRQDLEAQHSEYLASHPDLQAFLHDFMQAVLIHQPEDTLSFTKEYFRKMKT
ncbi:hypothetical protein DIPPA_30701 [Diplonema papillatum]|nr:hypothetical protein DIPPA_30701 [Diplonema papillatum]